MQQNLTAPQDRVIVSNREVFERAYALYQDETTPDTTVANYVFTAELTDRAGVKVLSLSEPTGISRPEPTVVKVKLTTAQMAALREREYRLRLFGTRQGEREEFVTIVMTVER